MNRNDGGPAFPTTPDCYENMDPAGDGMSLRDYFAAKAMAAFISTMPPDSKVYPDKIADGAYDQADAMLARRKA